MNVTKGDKKVGGVSRPKDLNSAPCHEKHVTKYVRNSKTISGRLHDELVMMDIDQGKYFSLNPVATRIWDLLKEPVALEDLCSFLMDEYEVNNDQCLAEVGNHLREMVKMGLVLRHEG
jgi:hypothetical protein